MPTDPLARIFRLADKLRRADPTLSIRKLASLINAQYERDLKALNMPSDAAMKKRRLKHLIINLEHHYRE